MAPRRGPAHLLPPGWLDNPSAWPKRARVLVLAAIGLAIASYLASYQIGLLTTVWDPIFGHGSVRVLHSALSRLLPLPDAVLGALGYLADIVVTSIGDEERWRKAPLAVLAMGGVVTAMAVVSAVLVFLQVFVIRNYCTLCLVSAWLSLVIFPLAWEEVAATIDGIVSSSRGA